MIIPQPAPKKSLLVRGLWTLASLLAFTSLSFTSNAATHTHYTVNTNIDSFDNTSTCGSPCSLRQAIFAANANPGADTIYIQDGTHPALNLPSALNAEENSATQGDLDITGELTIIGQGTSRNIIDASGLGGGLDGRALHIINATVTLRNLTIQGGLLSIQTNSRGSIVKPPGAGIFIYGSSSFVTLDNVEVTGNTIEFDPNSESALIEFTAIGGGIYVGDEATLIIKDSVISNNTAPFGGGINNVGRTDMLYTLVDSNQAVGGGGIYNQGGYLNLGSSSITNNNASQLGGGIFFTNYRQNNGNAIITNSVIYNNKAIRGGAGVASFGPLTISNSAITTNSARSINATTSIEEKGNGAGIFNSGLGSLDIINSTVSSNDGARSGGGIFSTRDVSLTNTTIYNNEAIPCILGSDGCIENGRIGGNQIALYDSSNSPPNMVLRNSIIGNGPLSDANQPACAGGSPSRVTIQGKSLEYSDDQFSNTCGSSTAVADLKLEALDADPNRPNESRSIGGQTTTVIAERQVHALMADSPALDAARNDIYLCPRVDQRFMLREDGNCDVGAYEYSATRIGENLFDLKATIDDSSDPAAPDKTLSYSIVVTNLYVEAPASAVRIRIELPSSFAYSSITTNATGPEPTCSLPSASNIIICNVGAIFGLGRVELFVSGIPQVADITITASVDVSTTSNTADALLQNNSDSESTTISLGAGDPTNFNGLPPGGGGGLNPLALLLITLMLLCRRFRTSVF